MSLPRKYDRRMKAGLGLRAVWLPGASIEVGDVLQRSNGVFQPIDKLANFGGTPTLQPFNDQRSIEFTASGTRTTIMQGGVTLDPSQIVASANASVKIDFTKKFSYFMRSPVLTGPEIDDVRKVGLALAQNPNWRPGRYFIAWQVYEAEDFTFLESNAANRSARFSGKGSAVLRFLTLGATAELTKSNTGSISVSITGEGGPVAMGVLRVRRNGD